MVSLRTVRNFAFVAMVCAALAAIQARVLAVGMGDAISDFCGAWGGGEGYDCADCETGQGFPPSWEAGGSCDFSGIEDEQERLTTAANYCGDMWSACDTTCETEYPDYLAGYYRWTMSETDPCYEAATDPSNWWTWGQGSCDAGETSTWTCSCGSVFIGEC